MGYLIPGGKIKRYGDRLLNVTSADDAQSNIRNVPSYKTVRGNSIISAQNAIARSKTANADISRTAPTFNDPRYSFTTLSIPTDQRTLNGLYRFFDDTDPVVGNAIRLHAEFPLSRLSMSDCGDPAIQRHFEEMYERINLDKTLFDIAVEYWRVGNVFPFGAWNSDDLMWDQFVVLNPDYVTVEGTFLNERPFIKLQPDEHLRRIVTSGQPKELFDQIPPMIVKYIRLGQEIPLSPNNVFHVAHNKAPYEVLGRSIIKRILKTLIYEDRMSMANFAIATRQAIPITVVKLGDPQTGWVPEQGEINDAQEMFASREVDPNFTIFYHWGIDVQFYGAAGKIHNLAPEFQRTMKWKMLGLGISEAILSGGSNYATAYAQLEVLRQRYLHFQLILERFIHRGIFEPVSRICGFYKTTTLASGYGGIGYKYGDYNPDLAKEVETKEASDVVFNNDRYAMFKERMVKKAEADIGIDLVYPKMDWDLMSLSNDTQFRNFLMNFDKLFPNERKISEETYYKAAKLDRNAERRKIKTEHAEKIADAFEIGKMNKTAIDKFNSAGIMPPPFVMPMGGMAPPGAGGAAPGGAGGGIGGAPPTIPGMPPPGGGSGPGGISAIPNAPIGAGGLGGAAPGGASPPVTPGTPGAARQESMRIQQGMSSADTPNLSATGMIDGYEVNGTHVEAEGKIIISDNDNEALLLKKANDKLLKDRDKSYDIKIKNI